MNWLTNFVRPKIRALSARREPPDNLWFKCPNCGAMLFHRDLQQNLHVCPQCNFHMKIGAKERLQLLFDDGKFQLIELPKTQPDPLKFRDQKRFSDRLKEAQARTGNHDAILVAHGEIGGIPTVVAALDFSFIGGSMGVAVGEGIVAAARLAVLQNAALIAVTASGGARMQEGMLSLMQMPRTVIAVEQVKEAGLPYLVLLTDPTTGGVCASFAMLGDVHIAEPGAEIRFAGARVIEETIRETMPEGFPRAEWLLKHGMVDMVVSRRDLHDTLARLLQLLRRPTPAAEVVVIPPGGDAKRARSAARDVPAD
ncbi:MAG TPA: acetyl-CoA carboxylase, carboxyltransferase subunit beta [Alphaproteobacteria bacterium]|nr:acetyl-CoA carboxylase, carboxyltransferase subunit beta [Alphaproteobacteria bacterium]